VQGLRFKVRESDNKQIHWVLIQPLETPGTDDS
jgi:hypothetical protein